jgi:biopolymer transport protein ExbD
MIRSQKAQLAPSPVMDLTALLDVIFIVLVFLLLTANVPLRQMNLDLPQVSQAQPASIATAEVLTLSLYATAPYWGVDDQRYDTFSQLQAQVIARGVGSVRPEIVLVTDKDARNENLLNLLNFLQQQQISTTQILTRGIP